MNNRIKSFINDFSFKKCNTILGVLSAVFILGFSSFAAGCSGSGSGSGSKPSSSQIQESSSVASSIVESSHTALSKTFQLNPQNASFSNESFSLSSVPEYNGKPYVAINNNIPYFTEDDKSYAAYEYYSPLDSLGRCGVTSACIDRTLMPTEERGNIGSVKPTGWQTVKYDCVDGKYLYNRCHLIGWQLTAENANKQNLITGTRYMNVDGMLPFENMVADYIKETNNHVLYRVTPVFDGNNLLASGVLMEAESIEDDGKGIKFCVFCYNVQPGVKLNYANGDSSLE